MVSPVEEDRTRSSE